VIREENCTALEERKEIEDDDDAIHNFVSKAEQIAKDGIEILDELQSITSLDILAIEHQSFILVMESRDEFPPLECLEQKLIEEEARERE